MINKKWSILMMYCIIMFLNGSLWISLVSVSIKVQNLLNVDFTAINWLSTIFTLIGTLECLPCTYLFNHLGLKNFLIISSFLNLVGAFFRLLAFEIRMQSKIRYIYVLLGNAIVACAQGFILPISGHLSSVWFPINQRYLSTNLATFSNIFGVCFGSILSLLAIKSNDNAILCIEFRNISVFYLSFCILSFVVTAVFSKEKPENCPSVSESVRSANQFEINQMSMKDKCKNVINWLEKLFKSYIFNKYLAVYAIYYSLSVVIYTFYIEVLTFIGVGYECVINENCNANKSNLLYVENISGYSFMAALILGSLSTFMTGYFDWKQPKKIKCLNVFLFASCSFLLFAVAIILAVIMFLDSLNEYRIEIFLVCAILLALYGGVAAPYLALGLEIIMDASYPAPGIISSCLGIICANLVSVILMLIFGIIDQYYRYFIAMISVTSFYLFSTAILIFIKPSFERITVDISNQNNPAFT